MKTQANDLILEITRRCNMSCKHCLRGDAEDLDMSTGIIDAVLDALDEIGTVCFSGGEPSLNLGAIQYFFQRARGLGKLPAAFEVITNGKENQQELASILLYWYPFMVAPDLCGVSLSMDKFHEKTTQGQILRGLSFYKKMPRSQRGWLIRVGRAADNGIGLEPEPFDPCDPESLDVITYTEAHGVRVAHTNELIYVSANGMVFSDCDLPYRDMEDPICMIQGLRDTIETLAAKPRAAVV